MLHEKASCTHSKWIATLVRVGTRDGRLRVRMMGASGDRERRKPEDPSDHDYTTVDVGTHDSAREPENTSDHEYTTVDVGTHDASADAVRNPTAINALLSDTPTLTPSAAVGPISSGEITAQNERATGSAPPPTTEPASNPDPTKLTKLDPGFVHLVPGTLVDAYEVEKLLGVGGMGAVYGAHHERLRRRAAIKVISPNLSRDRDAVERFEQEAHALARISHPNIVGVLGVGTLPGDGRAYFVMEWLDGESLQARLDRSSIGFGLALYVIDQIARGLEVAHAAGIVHRDLKPDNVWLQHIGDEPRPIVKILDLGLAKFAEHRRSQETAVNIMFGTPNYMSPEQCRSTRDVGPATDVYALGCIAYELLCGRLPFTYDNAAELVVAHGSETPPTPRSLNLAIPPELDALLTAMLAKDPSHRPTLAQARRTIATAVASPASAPRPRSLASVDRSRSPTPAARASSTSALPVDARASRIVFVALAGLTVLGAVVIAVVVASGGASLGEPGRVIEESRSASEIDASVSSPTTTAPSFVLDASAPLATSALRIDASTVTPRSSGDPDSSIARPVLDGGVRESDPTAVVEPDAEPAAVDTATIDASVAPDDGDASIEVETPDKPPTTNPPPRRTPPVPTEKKPPKRDVIINPFKRKKVMK